MAAYRRYDLFKIRKSLSATFFKLDWLTLDHFKRYVWREVKYKDDTIAHPGLPWKNKSVMSLRDLCLQRVSIFNSVFAGDENGHNNYYSMEELHPTKIPKLLEKYAVDNSVTEAAKANLALWPQAYELLMDTYLEMGPYKGRDVFTCSDAEISAVPTPTDSSNGIRPGPRATFKHPNENVKVVMSVNGKKFEQDEYNKRTVIELKERILRGEKVLHPEPCCNMTEKQEHFVVSLGTLEEQREEKLKLRDKAREFFIMSGVDYIIGYLLLGRKQKYERGHVIRIGQKNCWGAWYEMARFF